MNARPVATLAMTEGVRDELASWLDKGIETAGTLRLAVSGPDDLGKTTVTVRELKALSEDAYAERKADGLRGLPRLSLTRRGRWSQAASAV